MGLSGGLADNGGINVGVGGLPPTVANASIPLYASNYVGTVDGTTVNTTGFQAAVTDAIAQRRPLVVGRTAQPYVLGEIEVPGTISIILAPGSSAIPDPGVIVDQMFNVRDPNATASTLIQSPQFLGGPFTIDMSAQAGNQGGHTPQAIAVVGNVHDFYAENIIGKGIPAPAGNTINIHQNQGGYRPVRPRANNIHSVGVTSLGSSAVQLQGAADGEFHALHADGGVPWRIEGHATSGTVAQPLVDNCWAYDVHLSNESGFANAGVYLLIHDSGVLRNSGAKGVHVEAGDGFYATFDSTATPLDGCGVEDVRVTGGGQLQRGLNGLVQTSDNCWVRNGKVTGATADGSKTFPGWTYYGCEASDNGANGFSPISPSSIDTGTMTRFIGGRALRNKGSGLIAGAAEVVTLNGFQARDTPANIGLNGAAPGDLTANESGIETSAAGWVAVGSTGVAQSTLWAVDGTHSLELTFAASGNNARTAGTGVSGHVCTPAEVLYLECWGRPGVGITPGSFYLQIRFYDSGGATIGADLNSGIVTLMNTTAAGNINGFVKHASQVTAPAGAAFYTTFIVIATGPSIGDKFYFDRIYAGLAKGIVNQAYGVSINASTTVFADLSTDLNYNLAGPVTGAGSYTDTTGAATTEQTRALAAEALLAPLASPALTGNPTVPTQAALNSSTRAASTAYADAAVAVEKARALVAEDDNLRWGGIAVRQSMPRTTPGSATAITNGKIYAAGIPMYAGDVIAYVQFLSRGTHALGTGPHLWLALYDPSLNLLAYSVDDTTNVFTGTTITKQLTLNAAAGVITSYTIPSNGVYYAAAMIYVGSSGGTMPTLDTANTGATGVTGLPLGSVRKLAVETATGGSTATPPSTLASTSVSTFLPRAYGSPSS